MSLNIYLFKTYFQFAFTAWADNRFFYPKIANIFLPIILSICFGCSKEPSHCSKEPSHGDGSFEYPQHMFWFRKKKNNFLLHTIIWGPGSVIEKILSTHFNQGRSHV